MYRRKIDELEDGARTLQESVEFGLKDGSDEWTKVSTRLEALEGRLDDETKDGNVVWNEYLKPRMEKLEERLEKAECQTANDGTLFLQKIRELEDATSDLKEAKKLKAKVEFLQNRITQDTKQLNSVAGQLRERGHAPRDDAKTPKDVYGRVWS